MRKQHGFSFVEIVVAIVIMSIMAMGLTTFILDSAEGYSQTAVRNQVSAAGRVVLDRISMELRNALPNSVRISPVLTVTDQNNGDGYAGDQCIEFVPVRAATTYLDPAIRPAAYKASFDVVEFEPSQVGQNGVYAFIYPISHADIYDANLGPTDASEAIARVNVTAGVVPDTNTLTYSSINPTPPPDDVAYNHRFLRSSGVDRVFLTNQPVSYCLTGSKLFRYSDYGFTPAQMVPLQPDGNCNAGALTDCLPAATPKRKLVTDQIDNSALTGGGAGQAFDQVSASRRRNAVIQLELNFSLSGQEVRLNHEMLQQGAP